LVKGRASAESKIAQAEGLLQRICPVHKDTAAREAEALGISLTTLERAYRRLGGEPGSQDRDRG